MTEDQAKLAKMAAEVLQPAIEALDILEADPVLYARNPALVDNLARTVAELRDVMHTIPNSAQVIERLAKLQARVAIEKARA